MMTPHSIYFSLFLIFNVYTLIHTKECYVEPCTRDIVFAIDNSLSMESPSNVVEEISFIKRLVSNWTLSQNKVRVATFGFLFVDNYESTPYFDISSSLINTLDTLNSQTLSYGLWEGGLSECLYALYKFYVIGMKSLPRTDVQKRMIVFTGETRSKEFKLSEQTSKNIMNAGFQLSFITLKAQVSDFANISKYNIISIPMQSLSTSKESVFNNIINDQICFHEASYPTPPTETCSTLTPPKPTQKNTSPNPTKKPRPTTAPVKTEADYMNCSCDPSSLYTNIVICLDNSAGMKADFSSIQANIHSLVAGMNLDQTYNQSVRVSLLTFNNQAKVEISMDSCNDTNTFIDKLWNIEATNISKSDIASCLRLASNEFDTTSRKRSPNAIILYTSAYHGNGLDDPTNLADSIKENGISIITVSVITQNTGDFSKKIGLLASPRMNFTTEEFDEIDDVTDALCQVNCFCPNRWIQLIVNDRKFGECYMLDTIDSNWISAEHVCSNIYGYEGFLVFINSQEKSVVVQNAAKKYMTIRNINRTVEYHVGLKKGSNEWEWSHVGVTDLKYENWDEGYPIQNGGDCVVSTTVKNQAVWRNENCLTKEAFSMCMTTTCDTKNFCYL